MNILLREKKYEKKINRHWFLQIDFTKNKYRIKNLFDHHNGFKMSFSYIRLLCVREVREMVMFANFIKKKIVQKTSQFPTRT